MFQAPKGMEDFYPEEKEAQNAIFNKLRQTAVSYGFSEVSAPAVESFKLLAAKSGEEVKNQIFVLEKKGSEELALRPEITPGLTRMFVAKQKELAKPVKWFEIGRMWRYEAPQKGRLREFYQMSVELFGPATAEADAEIVNLAIDALKALGLTHKDFCIKINNRKLLGSALKGIAPKVKFETLVRVVDKYNKITEDEFDKELSRLKIDIICREKIKHAIQLKGSPEELSKITEHLDLDEEGKKGIAELEQIFKLVPHEYLVFDLSLARGLAYYTGFVFEIFDRQGKFRSIAGGGRYDNLVEILGGEKTPATGFAIGYATLKLLLEDKGLLPKQKKEPDYFVATVTPELYADALKIAKQLREKGKIAVTDLMQRKLSKQFEYANTIRAKKVIVVGPDELKTGKFTVKDMQSGKEEKKTIKEL